MPSPTTPMFSDYYNKLESSEIKERYRAKINDIDGRDPYTIKKSEWSGESNKFPQITWPDLVMYLVFGVNEFTIDRDEFKAFKSLEAYNQFVCGWVRDIMVLEFSEKSLCLLTCRVMHSQRLSEKALQPWVIAEQGGTIRSAHCDCMAGLGETCTHVASLLFAVEYNVRQQEKQTVTQTKAYWLVPSVKKVPYEEAANIDFTSAKTKKKQLDAGTPEQSRPKTKPRPIPPPTADEVSDFFKCLHDCGTKPAILALVEPYTDEYVPKTASEKYPKSLSNLKETNLYGKPYKDVMAYCKDVSIDVSKEQSREVEADTRDQAKSNLWFNQRVGRITASKMKSACHTDPRSPSQSLIQTICYPDLYRFSSAATSWGCSHEKDARKEYEHYMTDKHSDFQVRDAGLVIDVKHPHIGASPDGFVQCSCCGKGCIEVKCPFCAKERTLEDVAENHAHFCLGKDSDGDLKLKRDHAYYYQVQTQIHVTNSEYCDFILWTPNELHYERIVPEADFWFRVVQMATQFFRMCLLPELIAKFYTYNTDSPSLQAEASSGDGVCYCNSVQQEDIRACDSDSCAYKLFHDECLGYKDLILTDYNMKRKKWVCPDCSRKAVCKRVKKT